MIKANIFDIKRFGIQDGAGIRTVVFLKGCPLRCKWCQNPEGFSKEIRIWARGKQCIGCDSCIQSCPNQAIHRDPKGLVINPAQCDLCGKCEAVCPTMTLQRDGRPMDVPLRYNNDKRKKPLFSRGLSVCRHLFNSFSKLKYDEKIIK